MTKIKFQSCFIKFSTSKGINRSFDLRQFQFIFFDEQAYIWKRFFFVNQNPESPGKKVFSGWFNEENWKTFDKEGMLQRLFSQVFLYSLKRNWSLQFLIDISAS